VKINAEGELVGWIKSLEMVLICLFVVNECYYMSGVMMAMHDGNA